jgi:hypothetical protein
VKSSLHRLTFKSQLSSRSESQSELLYDWRFTANQVVLATSPLRPTTRIFIFQLNICSYSPYVPKLCKACYSMRVIKPIMPAKTLKMVYYSYFHSLLIYGIIFWGNYSFSMHIFRIQKRIIRVMSGLRPRDSCRDAFRNWGILPLQSQYIFSLLIFVVSNMGLYHRSSQIHGLNMRRNFDLYRRQTNLTIYQRGPYYFGNKLFNHLPLKIKELAYDIKQFRAA